MGKVNEFVFTEYQEYKNEFEETFVKYLINKDLCRIKKDKILFKVTGVLLYKNQSIIVLPKTYRVPKDKELKEKFISVFISVLMKYRNERNLETEEIELLGGENGQNLGNFLTAYKLIQDYLARGLLKKENRIKARSFSSGSIDWVSTVNKMKPIFSGNNIFYPETIICKNSIDRHNLLLRLHEYSINKSIKRFGMLLGINIDSVQGINELPCDINYAISFLNIELNSTFNQRDIDVIKNIIDFLLGIKMQEEKEKIEMLVTPYFYNVWETICGKIFKNEYKTLKKIVPKLQWNINSNGQVSAQRPDIIIYGEKTLYVLDAKYYDTDMKLPGWHDVVKQLFYASTIIKNIKSQNFSINNSMLEERLKKVNQIENAFLFPSNDEEPLKLVGSVNVENYRDLNPIKALKVNTFLAMKCYIGEDKYNFVNKYLEILNNYNDT